MHWREHGLYLRRIITGDGGEVTTGKTFWLCNLVIKRRGVACFMLSQHHLQSSTWLPTQFLSPAVPPHPQLPLSVLSQLQQRPVTKSAADTFQSLLLRLIVSANIPFAFIANSHFREYSAFLDIELTVNLLPKSGKTIRKWLQKEYRHRRSILK
jgi:hypothetical protein